MNWPLLKKARSKPINHFFDELTFPTGGLGLVIGGGGSGKSRWAEDLACHLNNEISAATRSADSSPPLYLATLFVGDDQESARRVARHRSQRAGKGFETIELPFLPEDIGSASAMPPYGRVALLDCLGNLAANQMFLTNERLSSPTIENQITDFVIALSRHSRYTIVVSNDLFSNAESFADETGAYLALMGALHCQLAAGADLVVELLQGIPKIHKGGNSVER